MRPSLMMIATFATLTLNAPLCPAQQRVDTVQGYPCSRVKKGPDGSPELCVLARATRVEGTELPAGTSLHFRNGALRFFWLKNESLIQGHAIPGQNDGLGNTLHPNGKLRSIWLARDEVIDGIPVTTSGNAFRMGLRIIRLGTDRMVYFDEQGRLRQGMLSRDITIAGRQYRKADVIRIDANGNVAKLRPEVSTKR